MSVKDLPPAKPYKAKRRLPRPSEIAPLFDLSLQWPRKVNALTRCADLADIRALAAKRVPKMVFDFVDGASGTEVSLHRARARFAQVEFQPRALRNVSQIDLSVDLLGQKSALPFFFAPTGASRLMHHEGEIAVARVAAELGIPYSLSTLGHTSIEDLATAVPQARRWFQLYLMRDRVKCEEIISRAEAAGFETILLAVDTPVPGRRNRDLRNGLIVPPKLTWRNVGNIARYPSWWFDKLTTKPVEFANINAISERPAERMAKVMDPTITIADVEWLRQRWKGKLVVKGLQSVEDAVAVSHVGVDAVHLSTHGGRQLDKAPLPYDLLPRVREAIDDRVQIFLDGGVMTGGDIVASLANGANAVAIGRAYLYGLMAAGSPGVRRVADLLRDEIRTTMALVGCDAMSRAREIEVGLYR